MSHRGPAFDGLCMCVSLDLYVDDPQNVSFTEAMYIYSRFQNPNPGQ